MGPDLLSTASHTMCCLFSTPMYMCIQPLTMDCEVSCSDPKLRKSTKHGAEDQLGLLYRVWANLGEINSEHKNGENTWKHTFFVVYTLKNLHEST